MEKTKHFHFRQILLLAAAVFVLAAGAQAQYASFFGDSITEYVITRAVTCYYDDDDTTFISDGEYDPLSIGGCVLTDSYKIRKGYGGTFNDRDYYKLQFIGWWHREYYIREDTSLGRLYRYVPETEEEVIICDMSLGMGDSIHLYDYTVTDIDWYSAYSDNWVHVDTVFYHNGRKVIIFTSPHSENSMYYPLVPLFFIEGIGPWFGPVGADLISFEKYFPALPLLLGVIKDNEIVHITSSKYGLDQYYIDVPEAGEKSIKIYPNPTNDMISVSTPNGTGDRTIYITDVFGTVVTKAKIVNADPTLVSVRRLSPGVYTILITDGHKTYSSKFVKQ